MGSEYICYSLPVKQCDDYRSFIDIGENASMIESLENDMSKATVANHASVAAAAAVLGQTW